MIHDACLLYLGVSWSSFFSPLHRFPFFLSLNTFSSPFYLCPLSAYTHSLVVIKNGVCRCPPAEGVSGGGKSERESKRSGTLHLQPSVVFRFIKSVLKLNVFESSGAKKKIKKKKAKGSDWKADAGQMTLITASFSKVTARRILCNTLQ